MSIKKRKYKNYDEYVSHQKEKTEDPARRVRLQKSFDKRKNYFLRRFSAIGKLINGVFSNRDKSIVCLGARMGEEVVAFNEMGFEHTIGIDLVPNPPHVIEGDFHNLTFNDKSVDIFYTNALDHSWNPTEMFKEVYRCLIPGGYFFADFFDGHMGTYEACQIDTIQEVEKMMPLGMKLVNSRRMSVTLSDPGYELIFKKNK